MKLWRGSLKNPNNVLHNILTYNIEEVEVYAVLDGGETSLAKVKSIF